jgi:hypothetical protein
LRLRLAIKRPPIRATVANAIEIPRGQNEKSNPELATAGPPVCGKDDDAVRVNNAWQIGGLLTK